MSSFTTDHEGASVQARFAVLCVAVAAALAAGTPALASDGSESKFAFRIGAGYELHAGGLTVTPGIGTDFVDGHTTVVYAVAFGIGF